MAILTPATGNPTGFGDSWVEKGTGSDVSPTATDGMLRNSATTSTINTNAGSSGATSPWRTGRNIFFSAQVGLVDEASGSQRVWIGLSSAANTTQMANDLPTGNMAAFRFSTNASDTVVHCVTGNGTTTTDDGSTNVPALDTAVHTYEIIENSAVPNWSFFIDGQRVCGGAITTTIPAVSTNLGYYIELQTLAASVRNIHFAGLQIESDK